MPPWEHEMPSQLVIITAPSGAGKTTLCQRALKDFPALRLSVSCTTRAPRVNEQNGVHYWFLTQKDFEQKIKNAEFIEWALVHGNYYGTSKKWLQEALDRQEWVLLDIDVQGAEQLKKRFPKNCCQIFIAPPSLSILEQRLRARGTDSEASIQERLKNATQEIEIGKNFDFILINNELQQTYQALQMILQNKLQMPSY